MVRTLDSHPRDVPWVLGKLFCVVTGPQAWCEVRMDYIAGPSHIFLAGKDGRIWFDTICLKLYQIERIGWWCLSLLKSALQSILKFVMLEKYFKKSWSPQICVRPTSKALGGGGAVC